MLEFESIMKQLGGTYTKTEIAPGIYEASYSLKSNKLPKSKTVYGPRIYPNVPALVEEAANRALANYAATGIAEQQIIVQGIIFRVPINLSKSVPTVRTAYPIGVVKKMTWSEHLNQVSQEEKLLYWVLLSVIAPGKNLPLDFYFRDLFSVGLAGDPGWSIEKIGQGTDVCFEICDGEGYVEDANSTRLYSKNVFLSALRYTLEQVSKEFPERSKEALNAIHH